VPIFIEETNPGITDNQNSFSGISFPGSNANYVGQTMGPGGMGMSAYMDRPETQSGWTGYDYSPGYDTNTYNLGQTDGPAGMGMSAYMDRPGPMEMAAPPDNIGYDRMGPDLVSGLPDIMYRKYRSNPLNQGYGNETMPYGQFGQEEEKEKLREYMKRGLASRGLGIETLEANVDPSDWRVIQQIMGAGGNPDDYIETADSYSPVNLIQMLMDAQDAGDDDLIELLQGDLEMMYPSLV